MIQLPNTEWNTRFSVLPEARIAEVSGFVCSAGTVEEARVNGVPETYYARSYVPLEANQYADYNIRSRHFRCFETFFIETDSGGELQAVAATDGLGATKRSLNVSLVVARPREPEPAEHLRGLFERLLGEAARYSPASKLRFSYLYDLSFGGPVGVRVSKLFLESPEALGLIEEARIANETGANREAVLLAYVRQA